jgi:hypothetical protein
MVLSAGGLSRTPTVLYREGARSSARSFPPRAISALFGVPTTLVCSATAVGLRAFPARSPWTSGQEERPHSDERRSDACVVCACFV